MVQAEIKNIIGDLEARVWETFKLSTIDDAEGRLNCRLQIKAFDELQEELVRRIASGNTARRALAEEESNGKSDSNPS
jgi:hypothetical protein